MTNHIKGILWKQTKDTVKNKTILIQFLMFPLMTIIMENAVNIQDLPQHFFTNLFAIMYVGMAPLTSAAAIISEEKEKNTLRVLQMCNVRAGEYLIGNAIYVVCICMAGSLVMGLAGGYGGKDLLLFLLLMLVGHCCSFLLGATTGVFSKNQMVATSITVPVMMVLSFLPMLSMFNDVIGRLAKYIFTQQLFLLVSNVQDPNITGETGCILACNILLILIFFFIVYKKAFRNK